MSVVQFRPRLLAQPPSRLPIYGGNPLTAGLVFSAYNAADDYKAPPVNYVTGIAGTGIKDVSVTSDAQGACPSFNGTTSGSVAQVDLSPFTLTITVAFWLRWNAFANDGQVCLAYGFPTGSVWPNALLIQPNAATGEFAVWNWNTNGTTFDRNGITRPSAQAWHHYAFMIYRGGSGGPHALANQFLDGNQVTTVAGGTNNFVGAPFLRNAGLGLMTRSSLSDTFGAGRIANVNIWNRWLGASEVKSIMFDSLQILDPGLISVGVPSGGGGGAGAASRWFLAA